MSRDDRSKGMTLIEKSGGDLAAFAQLVRERSHSRGSVILSALLEG